MEPPVPETPASGGPDSEEMADLLDEQKDELITSLNKLRKTATHTDVIIECADGQLHAHKCVLTSKNQYFEAMFQCRMLESKTNKIVFKQSSAAIEVILAFLYAESHPASLTDNPELLLEVIETSHMIQITKLFKFYWNTWIESLNATNLLDIWKLATKFDETETITRILDFVRDNMGLIPEKIVRKLTELQILAFFKHVEDRPPKNELVDLLLRWGAGNLNQRKYVVVRLVSSVDLNALTCAFVAALLEGNYLDDYPAAFKDRFVKQAIVKLSFSPDFTLKMTHLVVDDFSGESKSVAYDSTSNSWGKTDNLKLKLRHCTNWQPILSAKGDLFYYGISKNQKYVVFDPVADKVNFGPRSNNVVVTGFVDANELYFRERNFFFAVFNFATRKWTKLRFNMKDCGQTILVANGKIYFNSNSNRSNRVRIYDLGVGTWAEVVKPDTGMVNVRCKCLSSCCKGKLYFIKDTSLFVWNGSNGTWCEKVVPLLGRRVAVVGNCDLDLIFFRESVGSTLWLFYVLCDRWFKLPLSILDVWPKSSFDVSYSF